MTHHIRAINLNAKWLVTFCEQCILFTGVIPPRRAESSVYPNTQNYTRGGFVKIQKGNKVRCMMRTLLWSVKPTHQIILFRNNH